MNKTIYDDGAQAYLVEGATFTGKEEIPVMMDLRNTQIPRGLISFDQAVATTDSAEYRNYVHFYIHDTKFSALLSSTRKYLRLLQKFDGVISPDVSLITSHSRSVQQMGTEQLAFICKKMVSQLFQIFVGATKKALNFVSWVYRNIRL